MFKLLYFCFIITVQEETPMIGDNIKKLREEHDMTQMELAKICGVSDKAVSTWEQNIKIPRMGTLQKMADYFGIPKSAIIEDKKIDEIVPISTDKDVQDIENIIMHIHNLEISFNEIIEVINNK